MKIALLPALKRPITPTTTASRNRVVANLAIHLAKKGHQVTIFGTSNSYLPNVSFYPVIPKGLVELEPSENQFYTETAYIVHAVSKLVKAQGQFDVINSHMYPEFLPLLKSAEFKTPLVTTIHAQITPELKMAMHDTKESSHVMVLSQAAKKALGLDATVIYNGIDQNFFTPDWERSREYLLFIGRMSKAKNKDGTFQDPKGVQHAIELSKRTGEKLKIVGNVEDEQFFNQLVKPHLSETVEFVGKVSKEPPLSPEEIRDILRGAKALIFPINWEEPCPLTIFETQACGTPVISFARGSLPELVVDGLTGYVIDYNRGVDGLVSAVEKLNSLSSQEYKTMCFDARKRVEEHFTVDRMVNDYENLYQKIVRENMHE